MRTCFRRSVAVFAPVAIALAAGTCKAQTDAFWLDSTLGNGLWTDAPRWSINPDFPNNGAFLYNAHIGPTIIGTDPFSVSLDQNITIESLFLTEAFTTLDLTTNTLTLNQNMTINQATLTATPALGGGTLDLTGDAFLTNSWIIGVRLNTSPTSQIIYNTGAGLLDYICDGDVNHRGRLRYTGHGGIMMDGGTIITNNAGATIEFESDSGNIFAGAGSPTIINDGEIIQAFAGAITSITGVSIVNNGTLDVSEGTLSTDGVALLGGLLDIGTWRVSNGASLDLQGTAITTNAAIVELDGAGTTFGALAGLAANDAAGELRFTGGSDFTTAGDFTNDGLLEVGDATEFTVDPGSTLTNFAGGTLAGGEYAIGGTLRFDGANITTLDASVSLDGAGAQIVDEGGVSALVNLDTIDSGGDLSLRNGSNLFINTDLTVATTGRLTVGPSSTVEIDDDFSITNFNGGTFSGGVFEVTGTLIFDAQVETLDGDFTLDGPTSTLVRPASVGGGDVFGPLNLIDTNGALTLRGGRNLTLAGPLTVNGRLTVENGPLDAPSVLIAPGDVFQTGGVADLADGGIVRVAFTGPGAYRLSAGVLRGEGRIEGDVIQTGGTIEPGGSAGTITFDGDWSLNGATPVVSIELGGTGLGMADLVTVTGDLTFGTLSQQTAGLLSVSLIDGYVPSFAGDSFEIVTSNARTGQFFGFQGPGGNVQAEVFYTGTSVWVTVWTVPSPGGLAALVIGGVLATRRKR